MALQSGVYINHNNHCYGWLLYFVRQTRGMVIFKDCNEHPFYVPVEEAKAFRRSKLQVTIDKFFSMRCDEWFFNQWNVEFERIKGENNEL